MPSSNNIDLVNMGAWCPPSTFIHHDSAEISSPAPVQFDFDQMVREQEQERQRTVEQEQEQQQQHQQEAETEAQHQPNFFSRFFSAIRIPASASASAAASSSASSFSSSTSTLVNTPPTARIVLSARPMPCPYHLDRDAWQRRATRAYVQRYGHSRPIAIPHENPDAGWELQRWQRGEVAARKEAEHERAMEVEARLREAERRAREEAEQEQERRLAVVRTPPGFESRGTRAQNGATRTQVDEEIAARDWSERRKRRVVRFAGEAE